MGNFKIREFRKAKGLFQDKMAELLGLTQSNLSRYETNGIDLSDEQLDKLRSVYGKEDVDGFLTDSAEQVREKAIPEIQSDNLTVLDLVWLFDRQCRTG